MIKIVQRQVTVAYFQIRNHVLASKLKQFLNLILVFYGAQIQVMNESFHGLRSNLLDRNDLRLGLLELTRRKHALEYFGLSDQDQAGDLKKPQAIKR